MKASVVLAFLALSSASAFAAPAILKFPVLDSEKKLLLSDLNPQLLRAGLRPFPSSMTVRSTNLNADVQAYRKLAAYVEQVATRLNLPISLLQYASYPRVFQDAKRSNVRLCYTGDAASVVSMFSSMGDGILSDQFTLIASRVFKNPRTGQPSVLIMNTSNDSGDDLVKSYIDLCR